MKKASLIFAMLVFALPAHGQEESAKTVPPASREDVRGLQEQIRRIRREAQKAERESAARSAKERQRIIKENAAAISAAEKKLADKLESIAREARERSDDQLRSQRTVWYVTSGAILVGLGLVAFLVKRNRPAGSAVQSGTQLNPKVLVDPEIRDLKEFSRENNGVGKIPFMLSLRDGRRFNCVAELRDEADPLVYIGKEKIPVAWDKRRQRAVKYADEERLQNKN